MFFADSTAKPKKQRDTAFLNNHDPRKSAKRSALIPGWGQLYNRDYWKVPLVYGALAIPTATFIYNNDWYKRSRFAYNAMYKAAQPNATAADSVDYKGLDPIFKNLNITSVQSARNSFRRDRDYSILWFVLVWGLNIVEASVSGHLKHFDVSDDLSMQIHPQLNPVTRSPGLQLVFNIKEPKRKQAFVVR
ncbi:MAG: DUF5683 domain-containing protein [Chitinophagaceae bacterium]